MKLSILSLLSSITAASAAVLSLTPDNFESATSGKTVFIKFFAPWCGHCKAMAADWEKLADAFASSTDALIAEVDCTDEANDGICGENGVQGFPTLKYGNPSALEDYQGGRDYEALKAFADENLKPMCSPFNLDLCEGEEKAKIESYTAMSEDDLKAKIAAVDEVIKTADEEFEKGLEALQQEYMDMMESHEGKLAEAKESSHYKIIKAVIAFKKSQSGNDEL